MKSMLPLAVGLCLAAASPFARAQEQSGIDPKLSAEIRKIVREELHRAMSGLHQAPAAEVKKATGGGFFVTTEPKTKVVEVSPHGAIKRFEGKATTTEFGDAHGVVVVESEDEDDAGEQEKPRVFRLQGGQLFEGGPLQKGKGQKGGVMVLRRTSDDDEGAEEKGAEKHEKKVEVFHHGAHGPVRVEVRRIHADAEGDDDKNIDVDVDIDAGEILKGLKIDMPKLDMAELHGEILKAIHGQHLAPKAIVVRKANIEAKDAENCCEACCEACKSADCCDDGDDDEPRAKAEEQKAKGEKAKAKGEKAKNKAKIM